MARFPQPSKTRHQNPARALTVTTSAARSAAPTGCPGTALPKALKSIVAATAVPQQCLWSVRELAAAGQSCDRERWLGEPDDGLHSWLRSKLNRLVRDTKGYTGSAATLVYSLGAAAGGLARKTQYRLMLRIPPVGRLDKFALRAYTAERNADPATATLRLRLSPHIGGGPLDFTSAPAPAVSRRLTAVGRRFFVALGADRTAGLPLPALRGNRQPGGI